MKISNFNRKRHFKSQKKWGLPVSIGLIVVITIALTAVFFQYSIKSEHERKQEFYQNSADRILKKMLGKHNYIVNISIQYAEMKKEIYNVHYTPREVTEKYQNESTSKRKEELNKDHKTAKELNKNATGKDRSASKTYEQMLAEAKAQDQAELIAKAKGIGSLPGLIPQKKLGHKQQLPGFPKVKSSYIEDKSEAEIKKEDRNSFEPIEYSPYSDSNEKSMSNEKDLKTQQSNSSKKQFVTGTESKEDKYIVKQVLDENKETMIIPDSKIERMYVSIVLNSDKLKELSVSKEEVANIVKSVVGFFPERGDTIYLIAYSFKGFAYAVKKNVAGLSVFLKKYRIFFGIVIGVPLLLLAMTRLVHLIARLRADQALKKAEAVNEALKKKEADTKSKYEKQQDEIISLAKSKPEDFVQALVDWIEKAHGE